MYLIQNFHWGFHTNIHPLPGDWLLQEDITAFSRDSPPGASARVLLLRTHPEGLLNSGSLKPLQLVPLSTQISPWTSELLYLSLRLSPAWLQRKLILAACPYDPLARDLGRGLQCRWLVNWELHLLALFSLYNGQRNLLTHSWAAETSSTAKNNQLNWFVGFDFQCSTEILGTVVTSSAVSVLIWGENCEIGWCGTSGEIINEKLITEEDRKWCKDQKTVFHSFRQKFCLLRVNLWKSKMELVLSGSTMLIRFEQIVWQKRRNVLNPVWHVWINPSSQSDCVLSKLWDFCPSCAREISEWWQKNTCSQSFSWPFKGMLFSGVCCEFCVTLQCSWICNFYECVCATLCFLQNCRTKKQVKEDLRVCLLIPH